MRVEFLTRTLPNNYGIAGTWLEMEMIVGLRLASEPWVHLRHHTPDIGKENRPSTMNLSFAKRLQDFCKRYYVEGGEDFDCRTLVFNIMGWRGGAIKNRPSVTLKEREVRSPNSLVSGKPYAICKAPELPYPHYMLGIPRKGYSLSVGGPNSPLIIARNTDLMRAYKGTRIMELQE